MDADDDLAKVWDGIDKFARRAGDSKDPKDLVAVLSARGSQHSYAKASPEVRPTAVPHRRLTPPHPARHRAASPRKLRCRECYPRTYRASTDTHRLRAPCAA